MDKNHDGTDSTVENAARKIARRAGLSVILCVDPIRKTKFLGMLAGVAQEPVLYIDTDLLYAGGIRAGLVKMYDHITVATPDQNTWHNNISDAISRASSKKITVVVDSLNGAYGMLGGPDTAITINSHIAALATLSTHAVSSVIVGAVAKEKKTAGGTITEYSDTAVQADTAKKETQSADSEYSGPVDMQDSRAVPLCSMLAGWVMNPGGRQIPRIAGSGIYLLQGESPGGQPLVSEMP